MFMNDVNKKEEIRNIALKHLRKYGIKHRGKTTRSTGQIVKSKKLFHVPLQNLENETVTLRNGQQLVVPKRINELCSYILTKADTEGIFRKEGSKSRQNVIKLSLDRGCLLGNEHHVIDVAVVLKCFLRELPEPLIPYSFHELFVRCSLIEKNIEAILLVCLLLPTEHLNVLCYLMQFLSEVANQAKYNKMNSYNLSLLLGPNIFPINEKMAPKNKLMVKKTCDITKLMIDNSKNIGLIPDYIIEQIGNFKSGQLEVTEKVKRRRSGSLTRIFNGLKKIVGNKVDDDNLTAVTTVTPDLLLTPSVCLSKKRFPSHNKPDKNQRPSSKDDNSSSNNNPPSKQKNALERRWSAITASATNLRKKKRDSFIYRPNSNTNNTIENSSSTSSSFNSSRADYVRVSKSEYEDIKNRVTAIEKRLSLELENATATVISNEVNIVHDIQSAYEQTLVQTEPFHHAGSDRFVRRLSKELRIRGRNSEEKLIRSPSARKIGNIRRRSKESIERAPAAKFGHNTSPNRKHQQQHAPRNGSAQPAKQLSRSISTSSSLSSSPITTSISLKTNINNLNSNTMISFRSTPGSSFDFTSSMELSNVGGGSSSKHIPSSPNSSSPRRGIKRNAPPAHVSPPVGRHRGLKQRYCDFDGHRLIEITPATPDYNDKENGSAKALLPRIKRPMQVSARTPKRTPKGTNNNNRVNTPLRVLPSTLFNIPDF